MARTIDRFSTMVDGVWTHSVLSNGYIEPDGSFVEAEYQAAKAVDEAERLRILSAKTPFGPGGAKRMGRETRMRDDFEEMKFQIMSELVWRKFYEHRALRDELLATGDAYLIEGNVWHDNVWGSCICGRPRCLGEGQNWLGNILMTTRAGMAYLRAMSR